jgi:hypothetical protein
VKACLAACLVPVAIVIVALLVNGASPAAVVPHGHFLVPYSIFFAVQGFIALVATAAIAVAVSVAGSVVRWVVRWAGLAADGPVWRALTSEGVVIGVIVVGAYLGWAPTDVYRSPHGPPSIEARIASPIEAPLGIGASSDCFVEVRVTWRDGKGHRVVRRTCEYRCNGSAERILERRVSWGDGAASRVVVELPGTASYLFFPDPVEEAESPPSERVLAAYLRGEPVAVVGRLWRGDAAKARAEMESGAGATP